MIATDRVRVGDVLALRRREVIVDPAEEYLEIGVRSFGKGIFHKEPTGGFDIGGKRVFRIEPGDLVISNVFAWEGAIAVASNDDAGRIGSHRFMTFVPKNDRIDTSWAAWFFLSEPGLDLVRRASPGSAGRNRTLAIKRFADLEISLPPIVAQRAMASQLDAQREAIDRQLGPRIRLVGERQTVLMEALLGELLANLRSEGSPEMGLGEIGRWSSGGTPSAKEPLYYDGEISWAVIGDLNDAEVTTTERTITPLGLASSSAKLIPPGSVLVAMYGSIGKLGLSGAEMTTNQAIAACQPMLVSAKYLVAVLRCMRLELVGRGKGGAQQNISQTILKATTMPVPEPSSQARFADRVADALAMERDLRRLVDRRQALMAAVIPASMNEAFDGLS